MSKARKGRARKPPAEASKETVVYLPEMGLVKAGELKAKLAKEVKAKVPAAPVVELEKAVAVKVIEKGGRVTRAELSDVLTTVKQESKRKRGVTLARLLKDGFLARIKVPRMRAIYAVTEKGAKEIGVEAKGKS